MSDLVRLSRVYSTAAAIIDQSHFIKSIFADMEEVWLTLYTKEKTCPILEDIGTNVKRLLVRRYTVALIRQVRNTIGLDLITKTIDPDSVYWHVDDIVQRVSDNKTESHLGLFRALITSIFGLSIKVLDFMLLETKTKGDLYTLLHGFYDLKINDLEYDDEITSALLVENFHAGLNNDAIFMVEVVE